MRTRVDYFAKYLPPEIYSRAVDNTESFNKERLYESIENKCTLFHTSFPFNGSPEGNKFWLVVMAMVNSGDSAGLSKLNNLLQTGDSFTTFVNSKVKEIYGGD